MIKYDIEEFNKRLYDSGQNIRAISITTREIIFSNGYILNDKKEILKCKRRSKSEIALKLFDKLYDPDENVRKNAEATFSSQRAAIGGYKCQEVHGKKIVENLKKQPPWNRGMKGNYPYSPPPLSDETKKRIGDLNRGKNNGMYGKKYSQEQRDFLSKLMKEKILSGEFTPNTNNRNTHWESFYDNKKYRSSWEALYAAYDNNAEYEELRIPYLDKSGNERIYIVDFVNHNTKEAIEVKPKRLFEKSEEKINCLRDWCYTNGYKMILADEKFLKALDKTNINVELFDENTLKKLKGLL